MITTHLTDVTGNEHPVTVDTLCGVSWINPNAAPYIIPPPPTPDTTVRVTLTQMDGAATVLTVRYAEVQYLTTHYGHVIAANAETYARAKRRAERRI
jgi:hypothetical protein